MKKDEVINILTAYATNERTDKLIFQNPEYVELQAKTDYLLEELEKIELSRETQKAINAYDTAVNETAALYARFMYQQGLKDMFNLIMSLQGKGETIEA